MMLTRKDSIFVYWISRNEDGEIFVGTPITGDAQLLYDELMRITNRFATDLTDQYADDYFNSGFINPSRAAAYQLVIADAMTNDTVDNIYTSELYMQNLRAVMFPTVNGLSQSLHLTITVSLLNTIS